MRRRTFLAALSSAIFSPPNSFAQQPTPVRRITLILGNSEDDPNGHERLKLFRDSLRETGWIDGQNAAIKSTLAGSEPRPRPGAREGGGGRATRCRCCERHARPKRIEAA